MLNLQIFVRIQSICPNSKYQFNTLAMSVATYSRISRCFKMTSSVAPGTRLQAPGSTAQSILQNITLPQSFLHLSSELEDDPASGSRPYLTMPHPSTTFFPRAKDQTVEEEGHFEGYLNKLFSVACFWYRVSSFALNGIAQVLSVPAVAIFGTPKYLRSNLLQSLPPGIGGKKIPSLPTQRFSQY